MSDDAIDEARTDQRARAKAEEKKRLAAALRANLKRRKAAEASGGAFDGKSARVSTDKE